MVMKQVLGSQRFTKKNGLENAAVLFLTQQHSGEYLTSTASMIFIENKIS